jgi:hypothetical protein
MHSLAKELSYFTNINALTFRITNGNQEIPVPGRSDRRIAAAQAVWDVPIAASVTQNEKSIINVRPTRQSGRVRLPPNPFLHHGGPIRS